MPKVSVIIPVYGVEKYIERCARSLFEQTLDDIEYLFIDDCTPDKSVEVLKRVLEDYPNRMGQVIIHRMEQNCGQAAVRKWGMQNATGEYVIHCDSDDWVDVEMYKSMYEKAVLDNADIVICNFIETNGDNINIKNRGFHNCNVESFISDMFYKKVSWALWNKLVRTDILKGIKIYPNCNMGEDLALTAQLFIDVKKLSFLDAYYYKYFVNEHSLTRNMSVENSINCFCQAKSNCDIVIKIWNNSGQYSKFYKEFCFLQFFVKSRLLQYSTDYKCKYLYYSTYSTCDWIVILDSNVSFSTRLRCFFAKVRIYGFLKKLTNRN